MDHPFPSRPRIFVTRRWPEAAERALAERYAVTFNESDAPLATDVLIAAMADHDALCPTVTDRVPADLFAAAAGGRARIVASYGVGYNHIDIAAARAHGIAVTNTPDVLTDSTADLAIMLMLMAARRAGEGERMIRAGRWAGWRPGDMLGRELSGKTLGIVGFGRIGQAAARRARHGFGMKIVYFGRRRVDAAIEAELDARFEPDLHALLAVSDFVSLHIPGAAKTRGLIDADALAAMRRDAILVNTARGDVVDEAALAQALTAGAIAGAGLDVYANEPDVPPALLALDNVVLLPHLGSATVETRTAMGMRVIDNLDAFFAGREPPDRIA